MGLLRGAWRASVEVCVLRTVARQRETLITEQAGWVQRMHKALFQMNIQLTEVITDVMAQPGQAIKRVVRPRLPASRARQALKMAAQSLCRSESALGAFYRWLSGWMNKPRANTATIHKLARMVCIMLTRGEVFVDQGRRRYEEQQGRRSRASLMRRATALGLLINPVEVAA